MWQTQTDKYTEHHKFLIIFDAVFVHLLYYLTKLANLTLVARNRKSHDAAAPSGERNAEVPHCSLA